MGSAPGVNSDSDKLADRTAIERMLTCFQKASGNEVKLTKSFIIWLGPWKGITDQIFGIHPLIGSERYLGMQIASEFDSSSNWKNIIDDVLGLFKLVLCIR